MAHVLSPVLCLALGVTLPQQVALVFSPQKTASHGSPDL